MQTEHNTATRLEALAPGQASRFYVRGERAIGLRVLDLAEPIVNQKSGDFQPEKFGDHYETALIDLINQKRAGKPIVPKERPRSENVVDLMEALRRSVGGATAETAAPKKATKKSRRAASGQKEMLMPISGKKPAKETAAKKPSAKQQRKSA
jgi:DNA end-binding protein Ku